MHPQASVDPTTYLCNPFTLALYLQIALKAFPYIEGTCSLSPQIQQEHRVLLLTARHAVLPPQEYFNELYIVAKPTRTLSRRLGARLGTRLPCSTTNTRLMLK